MGLRPHSPEWYDRLAKLQAGFFTPWKSELAAGNGEQAYVQLLNEHLSPDKDVLDVGCGHGEFTLSLVGRGRSFLAYDRVSSYIEIAQRSAQTRGITNITFLCQDSHSDANVNIPAEADSFDLLISRRGPLHWLEDAKRVARDGARIIQLNPMETAPPPWAELLPEVLRVQAQIIYQFPIRDSVEYRLGLGGLKLDSCWSFDVPEYFNDPYQLYLRLTWGFTRGEVPAFADVKALLEQIFGQYANPLGLGMRHRRV